MTGVVLDTHVLHWWSAEPERLSARAAQVISAADELAIAAISWYELAWLAQHDRITLTVPMPSWLGQLADNVRTLGITPAIAAAAAGLPSTFPGDPADRLIFATAVESGWTLITKDRRMRSHPFPRQVTAW